MLIAEPVVGEQVMAGAEKDTFATLESNTFASSLSYTAAVMYLLPCAVATAPCRRFSQVMPVGEAASLPCLNSETGEANSFPYKRWQSLAARGMQTRRQSAVATALLRDGVRTWDQV
jgi:hypothetical protein